jgi:phosphohistidine phosphatase
MKRTLTLIRHAKSDWGHPELSDFDRPLNSRGEHDAPRMGAEFKQRGIDFDLLIASTANRAITTARTICNGIGYPEERIEQKGDLYLASAGAMLQIINGVDSAIERLAIVAHNPGITSLANALGDKPIDNMPTCGVVILETESEWRFLKPKSCTTQDFIYPKSL